jgi:hypothetical protein
MPIEVNEALLSAVALKEKTISDGRTVARKGALKKTQRSDDSSLLWGECQGSGKSPYVLSIDLAGDRPVIRCTCPVKPPPCKHTLGMLVFFMEQPTRFVIAEPPSELVEKREKAAERAEKRAEAASKPVKVNKEALAKKTHEQRDALELLETLVVDLASSGLATVDAKRARKIADQAKQMQDAYLPGAAIALKRLAALATATGARRTDDEDDSWDEEYYGLREPGDDLPDDARHLLMSRHLTRLWSMVRKGKRYLEEKLEEGESQHDADAVVEELLGRVWKLEELKERGHARQNVELLELAYERYDDRVREERVEQSFLLDLGDGTVFVERSYRPQAALTRTKEKESHEGLVTVPEAAVYPGFVNRRIRWEMIPKVRDPQSADWQRLHGVALAGLDLALQRFKEQLKNPLAPDEAVVLVRIADICRSTVAGSSALCAVDAKGTRLLLEDSPLARYRSSRNVLAAAGAAQNDGHLVQPASLLVRQWVGLQDHAVRGQPLALVAGDQRIRLSM